MEDLRKTLEEGVGECPAAHAKLGLVPVQVQLPTEDQFPVPLKTMKSHFAIAARVRVAAKYLGRTTLEDVCKGLLEMVDYAARIKFKKRLKCNFGHQDVLRTIGAHLLSLRKWVTDIKDPISAKLQKMEEAVSAALEGDKYMLQFFGIDSLPQFLITPMKKVPALTQLSVSYGAAFTLVAAASKFGDALLQKINSTTKLYLKWFASETYPDSTLEVPAEASDICETVLAELRQVEQFVSESKVPILEWSRKRHSRIAEELDDEVQEEFSVPPRLRPSVQRRVLI